MENVQKENDDHYSLCIINTCKINVNHITLYIPTEFIFKQITGRLQKLFRINTYSLHAHLQILTLQHTRVL